MAGGEEKPDFKDVEVGPVDENNRQCRDVFCCLLFLINICGMVYCTIHAYTQGNPAKIFRGVAGDGTICGEVGGLAQAYPYLYFYNPVESLNNRYCLKSCPYYQEDGTLTASECYGSPSAPACTTYNLKVLKNGSYEAGGSSGPGIYVGYETTQVIGRVCLPSFNTLDVAFSSIKETISSGLQTGQFASLTNDVKNNWQWLLAGVGFAILASLLFMILLKCMVGLIVWLSIIGSILAFAALGVLFLYNAGVAVFKNNLGFLGLPTLEGSQYYQVYGYICFGVSGLLLLLMICCCNRLRLAVAVCKVAGQFVVRVCQITILPIVLAIILIGTWAVCLLCMVYLLSATTFKVFTDDYFTSVADYGQSSLIRLYYFIFGTLWSSALIQAIGMFTIASSVCMWYYNHGANSQLDSPVTRSLRMAFRYHFGSLAFGSFILAVVQFLQMLVQLFKKQAENSGLNQNKCFQYATNCLRCCLACVERIVQFINETAYIQIALRGKNFCSAAKDGFEIVLNNGIRYLVVAGVGKLMMFVGRILIAAGTTLAFYALITFVTSIKSNIIQPLYLLVIIFIISFGVAALFMSVYSIAVDTILACFIVDEMNQNAKGGKAALYGPSELNDLLPVNE